jgi:Ca2+-binding RTX toxin-like protein
MFPNFISGEEGNDRVFGNYQENSLVGSPGNDNLVGSLENDNLKGDDGNDHLEGGPGDNIMTGGDGADSFDCGLGVDKVLDFKEGQGDTKLDNCNQRKLLLCDLFVGINIQIPYC